MLVEQNAFRALEIADTAYILESGTIAFSGQGNDLMNDERVLTSYLGQN